MERFHCSKKSRNQVKTYGVYVVNLPGWSRSANANNSNNARLVAPSGANDNNNANNGNRFASDYGALTLCNVITIEVIQKGRNYAW